MLGFLIFYYCFSVLFMIGYVDFGGLNNIWFGIAAVICMLIFAPIIMPVNLGVTVYKIYRSTLI